MNIQAIRLFLHVMQRGSLAAGAQQLNMSASAASRLLSSLERTTGLKLFSRDGHALRPTTEGAQYFNECHRVLIAVDELPRAARRLASGAQSRLIVGSGPRLASSLMIPTISRFAKRNPDAEIDFRVLQPHEFPRNTDRLDIAVGAMLPQTITSVEGSPLFDMPTVAVMRNDHPLASLSSVRAADLAAHKLIATATGPMREELEHMFHAEGVEFHPQYTASSYEHAGALLLQIGAVLITDPLVPLAIDPTSFALVPLKPLRMVQTSIFTPILAPESRLIAEFKACLREEGAVLEKRVASLLRNSGAERIPASARSGHKASQRRQTGTKPKPNNRSSAKSASK
jgi:DNA-binding transcriptional LysR family regulator